MDDKTLSVVAFTSRAIEDINTLAAKLDPRLYLFANYEPKPTENITSVRLLFLTNVINAYALMYDCGKLLQINVLANRNDNFRPNVMSQLARKHLEPYFSLLKLAAFIRNSSCHNMSSKFYNNGSRLICYHDFLRQATGVAKALQDYSGKEWERANIEFVRHCQAAEKGLNDYLQALLSETENNSANKKAIVQYWLDCINLWYKEQNQYMLENTLCSFYSPKVYPRRMWATDARKRLGNSWKRHKRLQQMNVNSAAKNYYSECEARISILLNDEKLCPAPALPVEFYKILTTDIQLFA